MSRIVRFGAGSVGVLDGGSVRDLSSLVDPPLRGTPYAINDLIARWDDVAEQVAGVAASAPAISVAEAGLLAPITHPRNLFAAPLNYRPHVAEMVGSRHAPTGLKAHHSAGNLGFFLKAPGSIIGPGEAVELPPLPGRSFHHEIELGVVIGREARGVSIDEALDHVFGYLCLLDITMRTEGEQQEERVTRKSFQTFTPLGPWIVTADEIDDPDGLDLQLWVGDELRQSANTRDLIVGVAQLISDASHVLTLSPGDIYATGTPDGVGPIVPGDTIRAVVEQVGEVEVAVVQRAW
ncbi:MAG TPA: fumarylacetoacetate hydrolase family protein [Solirubrobacteraceae bacterium]|nr:fumarylacetoacetate hydrolase family protein [Solirubrobacteraceae bacterium]